MFTISTSDPQIGMRVLPATDADQARATFERLMIERGGGSFVFMNTPAELAIVTADGGWVRAVKAGA